MLSFNLFAIPIRIEPWFWLTMALIGGALRMQNSLDIIMVLIFMLAGFISILVHELGHALTIRKFGLSTEITLHGLGGHAIYPSGRLNRKQSFLVTAAGPGLQTALAIILIALNQFIPIPQKSLLSVLILYLIGISIVWAVINCLPIYPLDGGQMMAALLGPRREHLVYLIGIFVAVLIGLVFLFRQPLLSIFMLYFVWINWQMHQAITRR